MSLAVYDKHTLCVCTPPPSLTPLLLLVGWVHSDDLQPLSETQHCQMSQTALDKQPKRGRQEVTVNVPGETSSLIPISGFVPPIKDTVMLPERRRRRHRNKPADLRWSAEYSRLTAAIYSMRLSSHAHMAAHATYCNTPPHTHTPPLSHTRYIQLTHAHTH